MSHDTAPDTTLTIQGTTVPKLGFGTWQITGPDATETVRDALEIGYRHIDTARAYENEAEVGKGIAESGVPREELFLVTKIWTSDFEPDRLRAAAEDSLKQLRTDYVDLLLLHWPNPDVPLEPTLEAMGRLREEQKIRHAGVSNFPPELLERALAVEPVFADQVEFHPYLAQDALVGLAQEHDLTVTAYSPLAHGKVHDDPVLTRIGEAHGKTAGQVALRWLLDKPTTTVIPKASSHERRAQNFDVWDFRLSEDETARIAALS
jgi:diketogulonate reductase-like aldo/keto reductase